MDEAKGDELWLRGLFTCRTEDWHFLKTALFYFLQNLPRLADYFALRKTHTGARWTFSEGRNALNEASHCDIAWAGALATHAHLERPYCTGPLVA